MAAAATSSLTAQGSDIGAKLQEWRDRVPISTLMKFKQVKTIAKICLFSCVILAAGGLLDTVAAMRSGFFPIWGTELCEKQRAMWKTLTNTPIYPDTFGNLPNSYRPTYIKSGQPCPDYTINGVNNRPYSHGRDGDTGWMFTSQVEVIKRQNPRAFCLEMTSNAINVHGGSEVDEVITSLCDKFVVYYDLLDVWRYGDPTSRKRLFIVGLNKDIGDLAYFFQVP